MASPNQNLLFALGCKGEPMGGGYRKVSNQPVPGARRARGRAHPNTILFRCAGGGNGPFMGGMNASIDQRTSLIFGRRSIRLYTGAPVEEALIDKLLEAAMAAPSAVAKDPFDRW